jgi:hypothetical protein
MSYILAGLIVLAVVFWGARGRRWPWRPEWRAASAIAATGVLIAAAFVGVRGGWSKAIELVVVAAALTLAARWPRPRPGSAEPVRETMSLTQARDILGVDAQASREDIQAAYTRLMRRVHPDHGGAPGLAVQLNLARERLLKP